MLERTKCLQEVKVILFFGKYTAFVKLKYYKTLLKHFLGRTPQHHIFHILGKLFLSHQTQVFTCIIFSRSFQNVFLTCKISKESKSVFFFQKVHCICQISKQRCQISILSTKGQLISKGVFGILNSPKKRTKFLISLLD